MTQEQREQVRAWILDHPNDATEIKLWVEDGFWVAEVAHVFIVGFDAAEVFQELWECVRFHS